MWQQIRCCICTTAEKNAEILWNLQIKYPPSLISNITCVSNYFVHFSLNLMTLKHLKYEHSAIIDLHLIFLGQDLVLAWQHIDCTSGHRNFHMWENVYNLHKRWHPHSFKSRQSESEFDGAIRRIKEKMHMQWESFTNPLPRTGMCFVVPRLTSWPQCVCAFVHGQVEKVGRKKNETRIVSWHPSLSQYRPISWL